ncbi:Pectin lyase-like superfamily protein [Perilla frutescens var. hirtella]|uniref:Pectinesterase n=1 Tax=Perilla frutescens var. hirtella TaxID=608512 RepID=A0AAD4NWR8_PERFH|nr:Pectin lyase-like superfamily protein [Perilla frutescens var. hirtella]
MSRFICSLVAFFLAFSWDMMVAATIMSVNHRNFKTTCSTILVVDPSGGGNFKTIQSAINSAPQSTHNWICIRVKQGVYRERVYIPFEKQFIHLTGAGKRKTYVVSDGHVPLDSTATFTTRAENIIVEGISFINSYNSVGSSNRMAPAVAAKIEGDKSAFYDCGFFGLQDTLWDSNGRHYFKQCTIEGAVDFIFGAGQSIYEKCVISVIGEALKGDVGYITGQGRGNPKETSGFVFKYCSIVGNGKTYLGRPWRKHARVIFYKTYMSDIIVPLGWDAWYNAGGQEKLLTFEEIECRGPGANTSGRVKWANKPLSTRELQRLISLSYVNAGRWLPPESIN